MENTVNTATAELSVPPQSPPKKKAPNKTARKSKTPKTDPPPARSKVEKRENLVAFLFILPPVVGFLIFTAISMGCTLVFSF